MRHTGKVHNFIRWEVLLLLVAVLVLCKFPVGSEATPKIDTDRQSSLTVRFVSDNVPIVGMEFRAYKVSHIDTYGTFTPTEIYDDYQIDFPDHVTEYRNLTHTLAGYVAQDGLAPDATALTDADGEAYLHDIEQGLYLVLSDPYQYNDKIYEAEAMLVSVPTLHETDIWLYDVESVVKHRVYEGVPHYNNCSVAKIWDTEKYGDGTVEHPSEVTINLLADSEVVDTVTLNAENNWRHTWTHLAIDKSYQVVEVHVPDHYKVEVYKDGTNYVITNTYTPPGTPGTPPGDNPKSDAPPPQKLPQTGQDWLSVIALAAAGTAMLIAGIRQASLMKRNG